MGNPIMEKIEGQISKDLANISEKVYSYGIMKRLQEGASTRWRELITPESQDRWVAEYPGIGIVQRIQNGAHIQVGEHDYVMAWAPHTLKCDVVRDGVPFESANPSLRGPERDRDVKILAEKQLRKDLQPIVKKVRAWVRFRKINMIYLDQCGMPVLTTVQFNLNAPDEEKYAWYIGVLNSDEQKYGLFDGKEAVEHFLGHYIAENDPLFMSYPNYYYHPDSETAKKTYYTWLVQREETTLSALSHLMPDCYFVGKEVVA